MSSSEGSSVRPRVAVILAAGNGSRLKASGPKPLISVFGLRLIERAILALRRAGVERFIVVTGAQAEALAIVPTLPRLRELTIDLVHCESWALGNGASLACGAAAARAPFFLVMADHVFDPAIADRLADAMVAHPDDVHLATDGNVPGVFDVDDATKVCSVDGVIVALGKQLVTYDRVDVGVFGCPASLATEAPMLVEAGATSVSEVMRGMIERRRMRSVPIDGLVWQDVDTPEMRHEAERRLLASTRKPTDGPISRWLNRPVSTRLTRWLAPLDVHPNTITTLVFVLGMIAAVAIATATPRSLIAAALLIQLASILDGCDGELARINLRGSKFGAWYDTITDNIRYAAMVFACAIAVFRQTDAVGWLIAGAVFLIGALYVVAAMTRYLRQQGASGTHLVIVARAESTPVHERSTAMRLLMRVRVLAKQDVLALIAAILLVLQLPELAVIGGLIAVTSMITVVDSTLKREGMPTGGLRVVMGAAGVGLLVWLLSTAPLAAIGHEIVRMGWGLLLAIPIVLGWTAANSRGLHLLLGTRIPTLRLTGHRVIGDSFNAIVPAAGVGGEPLRIAMLARDVPTIEAAVAIVSDRLLNLVAGLVFSAVGFAVAAAVLTLPDELVIGIGAYAAASLVVATVVLAIVRGGLSGRIVSRIVRWVAGEHALPAMLPARTIARVLAWNVIGRSIGALEVALYAYLLGLDLSLVGIVFVTSVLHSVGIGAFMVPQGIGVAEAASVYALGLLGVAPELALAFALVRRARILAFSALGVGLHLTARWSRNDEPALQSAPAVESHPKHERFSFRQTP